MAANTKAATKKSSNDQYTKEQLSEMIIGKLQRNFGRSVEEATNNHMFKACALVLRDIMSRQQMQTSNQVW